MLKKNLKFIAQKKKSCLSLDGCVRLAAKCVCAFEYPPPIHQNSLPWSVCTTRGNWEESHMLDVLPCEPVFEQLIASISG